MRPELRLNLPPSSRRGTMPDRTKIEWCDTTWNPIAGCRHVSEGCRNCYAEAIAARFSADPAFAGTAAFVDTAEGRRARWTGRVVVREHLMTAPLHWRKPRRIFVNSVSDLFHDEVPDSVIDRIFAAMALAPQHTFMVLTKRPERMRRYLAPHDGRRASSLGRLVVDLGYRGPLESLRWPLPNVWLGDSVEDQVTADVRRSYLKTVADGGWNTFVSYEPALGLVNWSGWEFVKWLISGGESGPHARPSHPDWHRAARDFCAAHGIAYLFKQWGEWMPSPKGRVISYANGSGSPDIAWPDGSISWGDKEDHHGFGQPLIRVGKRAAGRLLDGIEHNALPEVHHA